MSSNVKPLPTELPTRPCAQHPPFPRASPLGPSPAFSQAFPLRTISSGHSSVCARRSLSMASSQGSPEPRTQARPRVKPALPHIPPPQETMGLCVIEQGPQRISWPQGRPWRPFSLLCSWASYTHIEVILYPHAGIDYG